MASCEQSTAARKAALALIAKMLEVAPHYDALNRQAKALQGDFACHHSAIDESVHSHVIELIDAALGDDDIGSYFLYECQSMKEGGSVHEAGGRVWPLRTLDDLRAYLERDEVAHA